MNWWTIKMDKVCIKCDSEIRQKQHMLQCISIAIRKKCDRILTLINHRCNGKHNCNKTQALYQWLRAELQSNVNCKISKLTVTLWSALMQPG